MRSAVSVGELVKTASRGCSWERDRATASVAACSPVAAVLEGEFRKADDVAWIVDLQDLPPTIRENGVVEQPALLDHVKMANGLAALPDFRARLDVAWIFFEPCEVAFVVLVQANVVAELLDQTALLLW